MAIIEDIIDKLAQTQERLIAHLPEKRRDRLNRLQISDRAALIIGPRGTGKSTWLLTQAEGGHMLYLSADYPLLTSVPLFDLLEAAFLRGYDGALVDEVHYAADWAPHLKAAYDAFPNKVIRASDSSAIVLRKGVADLSRRFPVYSMPLLSFREYLMLILDRNIPLLDPFECNIKDVRELCKGLNVLRHFHDYMKSGFRPFFLESADSYMEKVMATIAKTMEADIPFLVPQITENHLRLMHAVIGYLGTATIPTVQVNSLCNEWGLSKEKLYQLLDAMERAHLIRIIRKRNDTKVHSIGAKMFLNEPSVYAFLGGNRGTAREAYVATASMESRHKVWAAAKEADYDFLIDDRKVEVGGKKKDRKNSDYVVRDDVDLPSGRVIPLWMLGLEY
jgi:predicted AAA+ superfamily ATPase